MTEQEPQSIWQLVTSLLAFLGGTAGGIIGAWCAFQWNLRLEKEKRRNSIRIKIEGVRHELRRAKDALKFHPEAFPRILEIAVEAEGLPANRGRMLAILQCYEEIPTQDGAGGHFGEVAAEIRRSAGHHEVFTTREWITRCLDLLRKEVDRA